MENETPVAETPAKGHSSLFWRITLSCLFVPLVVYILRQDHLAGARAPYLLGLCLVIGASCCREMVLLTRVRSFSPNLAWTVLCTCGVILAAWFPRGLLGGEVASDIDPSLSAMMTAWMAVLVLSFFKTAVRFREPGSSLENLGIELLTVAYCGLMLAMTAQLRWVASPEAGYLVLGSLIIAVKAGDIGAYTVGRLFGKAKLIPRLSPGKTRMGGLGALLFAGLASVIWLTVAPPWFGENWEPCLWYWALLYGVIVGAVGIVGDLCESLIKRDVGKKDASDILPGFGGILDLMDSVLYTGPVALLLWKILPLATWIG